MLRLFVQHVAVIGASLAFAFCRPASALDISVPHVSVPRVSVPVPHVSVPHVSVPHISVPYNVSHGSVPYNVSHGSVLHANILNAPRSRNETTSRNHTMRTQRGRKNTDKEIEYDKRGASLDNQTSQTPNSPSSANTYSIGTSADSLSFGCGGTPARTCR
jgi:hypothetical protein